MSANVIFYALSVLLVLAGTTVSLIGYRHKRAEQAAADARRARVLRQVESDRARFAGGAR